jgi:NADH-dependant formate dehydrogenase delta subunit FdsD
MTASPTEHEPPVLRLLDDISAQFRHLPVDRAAPQIVNHIRQFWPPQMCAELVRLLESPTGDALTDAVGTQLR